MTLKLEAGRHYERIPIYSFLYIADYINVTVGEW